MENLLDKLKTIEEHIESVYSERDLKLDEIRQHLKVDYDNKLLFHKEKKENLIQEWYNNVLEKYNVGTILIHKQGYRRYGKTTTFYIINSVRLVKGEKKYTRYNHDFVDEETPKTYKVVCEVTEIGVSKVLSKLEEVTIHYLSFDGEEYKDTPKILCKISEIPTLVKKHNLPNKLNHKLCVDLYDIINETTNSVQSTKDLLKKYGLS